MNSYRTSYSWIWKRSIRHNLSLKAIFVRVERPANEPGKGHYWAIDFRQGEGNKRDRKRRDPSSRTSTNRSRSDEEDDFSEEMEEDQSPVVSGGRPMEGGSTTFLVIIYFRLAELFLIGDHQPLCVPLTNQLGVNTQFYVEPPGSKNLQGPSQSVSFLFS